MAYKNLIYQTTTGTGTGNLTLSAVTGWRDFATAFGTGAGNPFVYVIRHQSAAEYEVGTGYMSDSTTLVRSAVVDSSNVNAAVNFAAGTKDVWHSVPAADANNFVTQTLLDAKGDLIVASAADTAARLAVGTNGQLLAAESGASGGLAWRWVPAIGLGMTVGQWYKTYACTGHGTSTAIASSGQLDCHPVVIRRDCTLDRIAFEYTVAGGAGCKVRLGIYTDNFGVPNTLVADSGEIDATAAAGIKEATISAAVKAGVYWVGWVFYGGTSPSVRYAVSGGNNTTGLALGTSAVNSLGVSKRQASVTGALPDPFTGTSTSDYVAIIQLRASA